MAIGVDVWGVRCSTVESPWCFGRDEEQLQACATASIDQVADRRASVTAEMSATWRLPNHDEIDRIGQFSDDGTPTPGIVDVSPTHLGDRTDRHDRATDVTERPESSTRSTELRRRAVATD